MGNLWQFPPTKQSPGGPDRHKSDNNIIQYSAHKYMHKQLHQPRRALGGQIGPSQITTHCLSQINQYCTVYSVHAALQGNPKYQKLSVRCLEDSTMCTKHRERVRKMGQCTIYTVQYTVSIVQSQAEE